MNPITVSILIALILLSSGLSIGLVVRRSTIVLDRERRWADTERNQRIALENTHRQAIANARAQTQAATEALRQQREIATMATDAAIGLSHDIARLIEALEHAIKLMGGKPEDWKRIAPHYGINAHLYTPAALKTAAAADWRALISEVQAEPAAPAIATADIDADADSALAVEALDTIGAGVGA